MAAWTTDWVAKYKDRQMFTFFVAVHIADDLVFNLHVETDIAKNHLVAINGAPLDVEV